MMQDDAPCHSARLTMALLQANRVLPRPSRSPDLNPIEHIWDVIGSEVRRRGPRNVRQLQQSVVEEWKRVARRTCLRYVVSMRSYCQAVIRAISGHSRY